jgi:DNA-binding CsgD family transcriptional regulator
LVGRRRERAALDGLLKTVLARGSQALVVHGEPGVGKTVLLDYLAGRAHGCRVARAVGVQSEMELAFAGLHQLCAKMLDYLERIPAPQRDALRTAFGMAAGPPPDRFLVGLGVLSLLSEVAGERPLVCLIDDEQWMDRASAQALGIAARRLGADAVGLVLAARDPGDELVGVPELELGGLGDDDARALLDSVMPGRLDEAVRDLILAESGGNPLALVELPRELSPIQLAGGFGLLGAMPLANRIEQSFAQRLDALPTETRRLLQLAASDTSGSWQLVWRAADRLGVSIQAAEPAVEAGLVESGVGIRFRHPLVRSAAYRSADPVERQQVHAALAEVTDRGVDPDRRAWHRAQATAGTDEEVAVELELSAGRAQARGGLAAAAAFREQAVLLTGDPVRLVERTLAAALASLDAGAFSKALYMLARMDAAGPELVDQWARARADLLRGQIAFASSAGDAADLLVRAAKQLEPLDVALARQTYLEAWAAANFAGRFAGATNVREVARAARSAPPPPGTPRPSDLLLDGLATLITDGWVAAGDTLRAAAQAFAADGIDVDESLRWGWLAKAAADAVGEEDRWHAVVTGQLKACRDAGLLARLVIYLNQAGQSLIWRGDLAAAASLVAEAEAIAAATGTRFVPYAAVTLAGYRGVDGEPVRMIRTVIVEAEAAGQGRGIHAAHRDLAMLYNGLGRYGDALVEAQQAAAEQPELFSASWALPELIEAASRFGQTALAAEAFARLAEAVSVSHTDWGYGLHARCEALVTSGEDADRCYREAVARLSRTSTRPHLARAHLLYGEWLRREGRRTDAQAHLRTAFDFFTTIGMEAFANRARHELEATGLVPRRHLIRPHDELTAQEAQIARLAESGLTNQEIGAQLFLSTRTVEWHLRKVFSKLGIGSRRQLRLALGRRSQVS